MIKLGILGSTRGSNLTPIIEAIQQKKCPASIQIVISNKSNALILERASSYHLPTHFVDPTGLSREAFDQAVSTVLHQYGVDLVVLIGYMRILSSAFVTEWQDKVINVHPSLLPAFAGKMDLEVHRDVLAAGVSESGCTVHGVTEIVDAGPIIVQKKCPVLVSDTPDSLKARVQALEGDALIEAITLFHRHADTTRHN